MEAYLARVADICPATAGDVHRANAEKACSVSVGNGHWENVANA